MKYLKLTKMVIAGVSVIGERVAAVIQVETIEP